MELFSLVTEALQTAVEHGASYRWGQSALRQIDKALWVVEKCARWAVPPPLDQDERSQPELVRPLPWVFFLMLLVTLRITRESISIIYLAFGKPPLRSADVVMYIQSKRRYLRTLKYQGNRLMRARTSGSTAASAPSWAPSAWVSGSWSQGLQGLLRQAMCFQTPHYHNNNSRTHDVAIVKRSKRSREEAGAATPATETTMERLIEKIMVDLDGDSDEDSSYTLTNATSMRSDQSELTADSEDDSVLYNNHSSTPKQNKTTTKDLGDFHNNSTISSTEKNTANGDGIEVKNLEEHEEALTKDEVVKPSLDDSTSLTKTNSNAKEESQNFLQHETKNQRKYQQAPKKIANGRTAKLSPVSKKETLSQVQGAAEVSTVKLTNANEFLNGGKENSRPTKLYY